MSKKKPKQKIIVFSCNWNGLSSLESAGIDRLSYSVEVYPLRLACLGRITSGIILKAFENGADGVYLIGCSEGECKHNSGNQAALQVFQKTRAILKLLGYGDNQLQFSLLEAGDGENFVKKLDQFILTEIMP
jgi:F420-non-reducing hydrogenase iron-sulfur subunit